MASTTKLAREIDTERALVIFFFLVGSSMFALSYGFESSSTALFPRVIAAVLIIGTVLLLFQDRLPEWIQRIATEPVSISNPDDEYESTTEQEEPSELPTTRHVPDTVATFGLLLGYIGLSFFVGILWATPVFALVYSWWFNQSRATTAVVFVTTFVIVFAFYFLVDAPLEDGLLLEWLW